jgi:hypothetical protein
MMGLNVDENEFDRLVSEDVKNVLPSEQADFLRLPHNQQQWKKSLMKLIGNLDEQIAGLSQDEVTATGSLPSHMITQFKISTDEKRTKINRFRFYVLQRISECERNIALGDDEQSEDIRLADFLRKAIETHQDLMVEYEFEATPIDQALWSCTNGKWGFVDMEKQIRNWN